METLRAGSHPPMFVAPASTTKRYRKFRLPKDPRQWTRDHVQVWLLEMAPTVRATGVGERFLMNGKALCLMTAAMFGQRVPGVGGQLLYKDFQLRLAAAIASSVA